MFRKYFGFLFFLLPISSFTFAGSIVSYEIIDIGIFCADESEAIAINDKGQVLGKLKNEGKWDVFLWDKDSGLQILDLPECNDLNFNNNGQIAGIHSNGVFIWDESTGFYNVGVFDGYNSIGKFNDNGQILIISYGRMDSSKPTMYLWNHGETIEISKDFIEQFPKSNIHASSMNNKGEIVLIVTPIQKDNLDTPIEKSFMWSEDKFTELFKEYGKDISVCVRELDDNGNMYVEIFNPTTIGSYDNHFYFVNPSKGFQAELINHRRNVIIRNASPQIVFCLPSELKKRFDGILYYSPGAEIRKLMKPQYPYWLQNQREFRIVAQNSKGYVVGDTETIYLEKRHAFLAVPYEKK